MKKKQKLVDAVGEHLLVIEGGCTVDVAAGPFNRKTKAGEQAFDEALRNLVENTDEENDVIYVLELTEDGRLEFGGFSGGFMDALREEVYPR